HLLKVRHGEPSVPARPVGPPRLRPAEPHCQYRPPLLGRRGAGGAGGRYIGSTAGRQARGGLHSVSIRRPHRVLSRATWLAPRELLARPRGSWTHGALAYRQRRRAGGEPANGGTALYRPRRALLGGRGARRGVRRAPTRTAVPSHRATARRSEA